MKEAKGYLSESAWNHSVSPTMQLCIKTTKLNVNVHKQCEKTLKAQFLEKMSPQTH